MKTKDLKKLQKSAEARLAEAAGGAQAKIKNFSKSAGREVEKAKDELGELEGKVKKYIKDNPEKLFVAAAGIGAFVGALTATLLHKKKGKKKKK